MKTIAQPAVITPTIIGLALLAAAIVFIGVTGKKVPLLSNIRVDIILLVIIGMTICTQGGMGHMRRDGTVVSSTFDHWLHPRWTHPIPHTGCLRRLENSIHRE